MYFEADELENQNKFQDSTVRLIEQDIVKADIQMKAFIQDIRVCNGPVEILNTLNIQVSEYMRSMRKGISELETLAHEQDKDSERQKLLKQVEQFQSQYAANQFALRKANLACQVLLDQHSREELFLTSSESNGTTNLRRRADKESLSKQSSSITDSLLALSASLSQQVQESEESLRTLASSSSLVTESGEELKSMGAVVHQAHTLLKKYGRREVTDKALMALAVLFFLICIAYVVHKRLF